MACPLPTKREQEGREMVWVRARLGKNKSRVSLEHHRCGGVEVGLVLGLAVNNTLLVSVPALPPPSLK